MIQNIDFTPLSDSELDLVSGGPIDWVAVGVVVAVGGGLVALAVGVITIGEKVHDAVCDH